ncbi:TonB-dependent receptor [Temperatibacter marinus]|uniref:TonB-dependent receptor n=1 Tax=Temperatibacter marinus TaxID=1456591 RepID=A0AA52H9J8_9PROT|nr:TonB-dependent receptor [Temperatibacter marinus]WND01760.1 TonB-dependent receptor [Temperatibacter marinus]
MQDYLKENIFMARRRKSYLMGVSLIACLSMPGLAQDDEQDDEKDIEEIVVTGKRGSVVNSIRDKQNADAIIDVLSADAADRLPDPNVAESLARLPGISFQRENDTGQGEFVSIRGLDAAYNTVTYDGIRSGTADRYRRTALDIVTSSNISGIEVIKAPLPEHASEGLGGVINIISRSPLKRRDRFYLSASGAQNTFDDRTGSRFSGGFNKKLADWVAVNFSASWRRSYINTLYINPATNVPELNVATTLTGKNGTSLTFIDEDPLERVPTGFIPIENFNVEQVNYEDNNIERDNLTLSGMIDFKLSDSTTFTLGGRRTKEDTIDTYSNLEMDVDNGDILMDSNGIYQVATYPDPEITFEGEVQDSVEIRERYFAKGQTIKNNWTFDYIVGYSRAFENQPIMSMDFTHELEDTPSGLSDNSAENINTYAPFDFSNSPFIMPVPVNLAAFQEALDPFCDDGGCGEMNDFDEELEDSLENKRWTARFDTTYDFDNHDFMQNIKFGLQYEKSKYRDYRAVIALQDESISEDGNYVGYDPSGDNNADLGDYGIVDGSLRSFDDIGNPFDSVGFYGIPLWNGDAMRALRQNFRNGYFASGDAPVETEITSTEEYYTAYLQGKMTFDKLDIIGGLRVEKYKASFRAPTDLSSLVFFDDGNGQGDSLSLVDTSVSYNETTEENTEYLPRIAFIYNLRDDMKVRFAYTTALARPTFDLLAAEVDGSFNIELADGVQLANATAADVVDVSINYNLGNPTLKNGYSHNFDLSWEYYIDSENAISVAAYYKRIDNFIFNTFTLTDVDTNVSFDAATAIQAGPFTDEGLAVLEQLGGINSLIASGVGDVSINIPDNGRKAEVYGIELGIYHTFDWLGGFWENVGFAGNLTIQDTKTTVPLGVLEADDALVLLGDAQEGEVLYDEFQFFNSPNVLYNAALFYQDDKWEVTVGYRYGGRQLEEIELFGMSQYQQGRGFLDFSLERRLDLAGVRTTVYFSANDILDGGTKPTTFETRGTAPIYSDFATFNGRSFRLGARLSF